jgi:hypothetical protein
VGPNRASNVRQNRRAHWIARKCGLTPEQYWRYKREIEKAKNSGAYDPDIDGNLSDADLEDIARDIANEQLD